jgi:hypothetical protein
MFYQDSSIVLNGGMFERKKNVVNRKVAHTFAVEEAYPSSKKENKYKWTKDIYIYMP